MHSLRSTLLSCFRNKRKFEAEVIIDKISGKCNLFEFGCSRLSYLSACLYPKDRRDNKDLVKSSSLELPSQ